MNASAKTIIVDDNGTPGVDCDLTTIQEGIDNAIPGDIVFVMNGTYYESVVVNKTINLTGEYRGSTIIDGGGSGDVVFINSNWVNMSGFKVRNSGSGWWDVGIELNNVQNCSIIHNTCTNNYYDGIYLEYSSYNIVEDNKCISNTFQGIYLEGSSNNVIKNNTCYNNNWYGLRIGEYSNSNIIVENIISYTNNYGIRVLSSNNNLIYHNNFMYNFVQAWDDSFTYWDNGYPSGGNYWSN
ncbi:MAG: right-handed parallel beta-helix repeat-containing protein [Thermoplasmata archaeon]|nr:MAG: right-handed parallel beta-helix repeat-containing protein [Thermoplasmata archaeon]